VKISVLCFDLSSNAFGRAWLLAKALSRVYDVEIIGTSRKGGIWAPMRHSKIPVKEFPWCRYPKFSRIKKNILDAIDGNIILVSKLMPTSFGIGLQKKNSSGKPLIVDIDDWELGFFYHSGLWGKVGRFLNLSNPNGLPYVWWMERVVASADAISVSNQFLQKKFGGLLLPHCRDTTVLDPLKFDPDQIKEKMGFKDKKVVMFLGTPRPHKGLDDLLEAFKNIDNPNLSLLIVGAENQQEFLNRVDHLIRDRVVVLPKTPFQKLPELLSVADIIAIPQRRTSDSVGQIPARLFDAMSMAKPIIATRVSDIPEVLGECGYLIDPNKPSQLANSIQYVFDHFDEALIKGRAARERCKQVYDIHNLEIGLCGLVEQILSKKARQ